MASSPNATSRGPRTASETETGVSVPVMVVLAWLVPGAAHAAQGRVLKGVVLFASLMALFTFGVIFEGRVFPLQMSDPLVFLAAIAQWGVGLPRIVAGLAGWGDGNVTAITYEYGNTFLITSGLLNALVVLDASDLASGRRGR